MKNPFHPQRRGFWFVFAFAGAQRKRRDANQDDRATLPAPALKAWAPCLPNRALPPLAILAGLLPLTFAGVGTADAALVLFYTPYFDAPTAAALGILCTARYVLPAIGGLPFVGQYLPKVRAMKKSDLAGDAAA